MGSDGSQWVIDYISIEIEYVATGPTTFNLASTIEATTDFNDVTMNTDVSTFSLSSTIEATTDFNTIELTTENLTIDLASDMEATTTFSSIEFLPPLYISSDMMAITTFNTIEVIAGFGQVTLTDPGDTTQQTRPITFTWASYFGMANYRIQIATDSGFTNIIEDNKVVGTSYKANDLLCGTTYFWRVMALV